MSESRRSGRVEICLNNRWGTVCDFRWQVPAAQVACRQLGFSTEGVRTQDDFSSAFNNGLGEIWVTDVTCAGNESRVIDCPHSTNTSTCNHGLDAGAACRNFPRATSPASERGHFLSLVDLKWNDPYVKFSIPL